MPWPKNAGFNPALFGELTNSIMKLHELTKDIFTDIVKENIFMVPFVMEYANDPTDYLPIYLLDTTVVDPTVPHNEYLYLLETATRDTVTETLGYIDSKTELLRKDDFVLYLNGYINEIVDNTIMDDRAIWKGIWIPLKGLHLDAPMDEEDEG